MPLQSLPASTLWAHAVTASDDAVQLQPPRLAIFIRSIAYVENRLTVVLASGDAAGHLGGTRAAARELPTTGLARLGGPAVTQSGPHPL